MNGSHPEHQHVIQLLRIDTNQRRFRRAFHRARPRWHQRGPRRCARRPSVDPASLWEIVGAVRITRPRPSRRKQRKVRAWSATGRVDLSCSAPQMEYPRSNSPARRTGQRAFRARDPITRTVAVDLGERSRQPTPLVRNCPARQGGVHEVKQPGASRARSRQGVAWQRGGRLQGAAANH